MTTETTRDRGRLIDRLPGYMGSVYVNEKECPDCGTRFTSKASHGRYEAFTINGKINDGFCPWCRVDSKPWTHGRGL